MVVMRAGQQPGVGHQEEGLSWWKEGWSPKGVLSSRRLSQNCCCGSRTLKHNIFGLHSIPHTWQIPFQASGFFSYYFYPVLLSGHLHFSMDVLQDTLSQSSVNREIESVKATSDREVTAPNRCPEHGFHKPHNSFAPRPVFQPLLKWMEQLWALYYFWRWVGLWDFGFPFISCCFRIFAIHMYFFCN